ncbi:MAG: hypothetical protein KDB53_14705, partial [Planctomycetes bacterium]|nr:hypothetical protein [Planctomycetota bacterium]
MSFRTSPRFLPIAVALLLGVTGLSAQGTFVIPAGFGAIDGAGTSFPFGNTNDHIWQWHYDASEFINAGINFPIAITNVAVRADSPTATVPAFNFPSVEIELIEASTNWANGTHNTTFAANILTSSIVRTAAPWVGGPVPPSGGATAPFIPIGFDAGASFIFDPTAGNDFIIQVRKCGTIASWGVTMDGANLANATRYGHSSSCTATVSTFSNPTFCPIAELTWQPVVLAPDDIQVQDVTAPVTGVNACTPLSVFEIVTATLRNAGANPIVGGTQIPVSYTIDGGVNVTSEIFTPAVTLNPGDTASFSFATGANMSTPGIYTVAVTASWGLDGNPMNDSRSVTVESIGGVTINSFPWTENFDGF